MKDKIKKLLLDEFYDVYCYNCAFEQLTEEEAEEKYGCYGCEYCNRKQMNWQLSEHAAEELADKIIKMMVHGYAER